LGSLCLTTDHLSPAFAILKMAFSIDPNRIHRHTSAFETSWRSSAAR
jgi:hypothetical protein